MCFTLSGGSAQHIPGRELYVIPKPTFTPLIGIAGSISTITLLGSASEGDFASIQEGNCIGAHAAFNSENTRVIQ